MKIRLDMIPIVNNNTVWKEHNGEIVLSVKNNGILNRILQKTIQKPEISYIRLDKIGSHIWKLLDGNNSVRDIGISIEKEFSESVFPLYDRLITFLLILKENKLIRFR